MTWQATAVDMVGRGPLLTRNALASKKRRSHPIHGYVGPNGAGKSLMMVKDTLDTLAGVQWSCDNPDHPHTWDGVTSGTRRVLSTMKFLTPSGSNHPLWVPLEDFSQIIHAYHVDLILDEVGGAIASSTGADIPMGVKAALQELRRREVVCRWTAPSWKRASNILRETSQAVTLVQGFAGVPHVGTIDFDGKHETEILSPDSERLEKSVCQIEEAHTHEAGRLWAAKRLMFARTFDATVFEEWTAEKRKAIRPMVRELFWRPGSRVEKAYDTHAFVEKLGQVTDSGRCDHCNGRVTPKKCICEDHNQSVRSRRLAHALTIEPEE